MTAMTIELVKILEAAQEYRKEAEDWFTLSNKYEGVDNEKADVYMKHSREAKCKCNTMLQAFEILTGYKVYRWEIDDALAKA